MRIGIDARPLCGHPTGVGQYLLGLVREWAGARGSAHEFVLYAPQPLAVTLDTRKFRLRIVAGSSGTWWEQTQLPRAARADGLDVFFSPGYTAPLMLSIPTVVAIHDVSFAAHPEWFRTREGIRLRWLSRRAAAAAHSVITISTFSQREIAAHLGVPSERVHVIPPGVPDRRRADGNHEEPRVLFVGSIFSRRHVGDLVRAFGHLAYDHPTASLDIVGDDRSYPAENLEGAIARQQLASRIRWHRYASDEQLQDLYSRARAFAFLSEYEGLGLTPLEALTAGVPPVLLDTEVARESCGDAALYVPAGSLPPIARALEQALFDDSVRARVLAAAPAVLSKYSWARCADGTLAVLEEAAK